MKIKEIIIASISILLALFFFRECGNKDVEKTKEKVVVLKKAAKNKLEEVKKTEVNYKKIKPVSKKESKKFIEERYSKVKLLDTISIIVVELKQKDTLEKIVEQQKEVVVIQDSIIKTQDTIIIEKEKEVKKSKRKITLLIAVAAILSFLALK